MGVVTDWQRVPVLQCGIYRHWKGHLYQVLGLALDAHIENRVLVVYVGLELTGTPALGPRMRVRPIDDFFAFVDPETGETVSGLGAATKQMLGLVVPRFRWYGAGWHGPEDEELDP